MSLKTDYKDDIFAGARKYQIVNNPDGTVSFVDVTDYIQEGDYLGAQEINAITSEANAIVNDINTITDEVNKKAPLPKSIEVTLLASGWLGSAVPFNQTVNITGLLKSSVATVAISPSATLLQYTAGSEAMLHPTGQADGSITISAFDSKPSADIPIVVCILS